MRASANSIYSKQKATAEICQKATSPDLKAILNEKKKSIRIFN